MVDRDRRAPDTAVDRGGICPAADAHMLKKKKKSTCLRHHICVLVVREMQALREIAQVPRDDAAVRKRLASDVEYVDNGAVVGDAFRVVPRLLGKKNELFLLLGS